MPKHFGALFLAPLQLLTGCAAKPAVVRPSAVSASPRAVPVREPAQPLSLVMMGLATDKARYSPREPVRLTVSLTNKTGKSFANCTVSLVCQHLAATLAHGPASQRFRLASGETKRIQFVWQPPAADFQGYRVEAAAQDTSRALGHAATAVDVSSDWTRFPRYGFLSEYPAQPRSASRALIQQMKDFHLNAIQFYDWQWRHEKPLAGTVASPAASWKDLANRPTYRQTILDFIGSGHDCGMASMNYNLLYGAWSGYSDYGVDYRWGLWTKTNGTDQYSIPLPQSWQTSQIYFFNPADPGWQKYLIGEEAKVFAAYPYDGWHIDQIGSPPEKVYDYSGNFVDVWKTFKPFLNAAKPALKKKIIFNNVGGYGLYDTAANTGEDAVYVECWPFAGQKTYNDLKTTADQIVQWSHGKGIILAAYMDSDYANTFANRPPGTFNAPGILLTDAAIFAAGASHIEMGDGSNLLDNEYYPNRNLVPSAALKSSLRSYYDFQVAYENLLHGTPAPASEAAALSVASSADASPNTVWAFSKTTGPYHVLSLINLLGEADNSWADKDAKYPAPTPQANITVKYYGVTGTVTGVNWATPDSQNGKSEPLPFTISSDARGQYLQFTVPRLAYWDTIFVSTT